MNIHDKESQKINPATEENQEIIIGLMGGSTGGKTPAELSAEEIAAMRDGAQKTKLVTDAGAELYPAGKGAFVQVRLTRPVEGSPVQYTANDAINSSVANPVSVNVPNFALAAGRAAYIMAIQATTNMLNLVDGTIRLWLYRTEPTGIVGDNVAMTNDDANTTKGRHYIDIKFNSLLANSTTILGIKEPVALYVTDPASADLKLRVQTLTAFTPVSAGWIDIAFTLLQL